MTLGRGSRTCSSPTAASTGLVVPPGRRLHGRSAVVDETTVIAGGAAKLPVVARTTVGYGLTGFEWAVGVPGSIGGAVRMNAGGHGADMKPTRCSTPTSSTSRAGERIASCPPTSCSLSYRHSALTARSNSSWDAASQLDAGRRAHGARRTMAEIVQWRRDNQPGGQNAGSVFTNPDGDSAGRLIDSPPAARACGSAPLRCPTSTPTSSRPTKAAPPPTCSRS